MQQGAEVRVFLVQRAVAVGERGGGADFQVAGGLLDALELGHMADVDHHRQGLVELGDFQGQVGTAGQQPRLGVRAVQVGQVGDGQRHQAAFVAAVQLASLGWRDGLEAADCLRLLGIELVAAGLAATLLGSIEDRPVAGAAAQVAGQGLLGLVQVGAAAVLLQGEQRHDEAGGAEAALRAMAIGHGLLHAVQLALVLETLDADQLLAVQRRNEGQARVQAAVAQAVVALVVLGQFADHHGAGAAVTTGAALLGARFAQVLAQVLQHRHVWVQGMLTTQLLVDEKLDHGDGLAMVLLLLGGL